MEEKMKIEVKTKIKITFDFIISEFNYLKL